jgi:hypothetical protein
MKTFVGVCVLLVSISLHPGVSHAAWSIDGNIIAGVQNYQFAPAVVPDGAGGAIIVWGDVRNGNEDIYAQRVNASGVAQWAANGVVICNAAFDQGFHQITTDGSGGAIITWRDRRGGTFTDIYAQRINPAGVVQWAANGVVICNAANDQQFPAIVADGSGGATIAWQDSRVGMGNFPDIYAQHINALGLVQWTANGVLLCNAAHDQVNPTLASDGSLGAIVAWQDLRNLSTNDIYAQRIDGAGVVQWTANGVVICNALNHQFNPLVISDGAGGALITWGDARSAVTGNDIYAQRINSTGTVQWTANGVPLCTAANGQFTKAVCSDGAGGVIAAWWDQRTGAYDVYAGRLDPTGAAPWTANGVAICTAADEQGMPAIAADGAGGAIVAWHDNRTPTNAFDIYAQRINSAGAVQWTADGVALCTATRNQLVPALNTDGTGGAIVAWQDLRNGNENLDDDDIYAVRVSASGAIPTAVHASTPAANLSVGASYPNPFTAETSLDLTLRRELPVSIEVFDVAGRRVRAIDLGRMHAGPARLTFDGLDERAHALPSGVYFYRVHAGNETVTKKMVIAR